MTEIVDRSRQEAFKLLERAGATPRREPPALPLAGRFFAGAGAAETPEIARARAPEACRALIAEADEACAGRFRILGHGTVDFGDPIDWHLDPIAHVRAPAVHWSRLDVLDRAQVGDSKIPWELNRHQWLARLGQAYRLTGDPRHPEAFARAARSWLDANPRGRGIAWASSLEVSLRLMSWLWALTLFAGAPELPNGLEAELVVVARDHAAHVDRHLSRYYAPNTHLTGEALGLLHAGLLLPGARRARRWRERGLRILTEECERQIAPDGGYFEDATGYARSTAEIYLHALILAARNGLAFPPAVERRVTALLDQLLWLRAPNGSLPMIGDADGGWLVPLAIRAPDDLRGVFSTAAAWFGRADYAEAAGGRVAPETVWLLGAAGVASFDALSPAHPTAPPSRLFPDAGMAVMRSSWEPGAHQLLLDVGPLRRSGHAHADLLSVQCAPFGVPRVVDPGTFCYTADAGWRDAFRGTAAHSTVTVDGLGQAAPARPFHWASHPGARLRAWRSTASCDYADAEHDGYRAFADPVGHRRRVLFLKPRLWVLVDDLTGAEEHAIDLRFQFAPGPASLLGGGWARADAPDGRGLFVRASAGVPLELGLHAGRTDPPAGWVSPDYGDRRPAPMLVYSVTARLPLRIVTLLVPAARPGPPPAVEDRLDEHGLVRELVFPGTGERVLIDAETVRAEPPPGPG